MRFFLFDKAGGFSRLAVPVPKEIKNEPSIKDRRKKILVSILNAKEFELF